MLENEKRKLKRDRSSFSEEVMGSEELSQYEYDHYDFSGDWQDFLGLPSTNFHCLVFGRPKQGKSIFSIRFADYLSRNFGSVLYIASEEGFGATLKQKINDFSLKSNPNLHFGNFRTFETIRDNISGFDFVFIDSEKYGPFLSELNAASFLLDNLKHVFSSFERNG